MDRPTVYSMDQASDETQASSVQEQEESEIASAMKTCGRLTNKVYKDKSSNVIYAIMLSSWPPSRSSDFFTLSPQETGRFSADTSDIGCTLQRFVL